MFTPQYKLSFLKKHSFFYFGKESPIFCPFGTLDIENNLLNDGINTVYEVYLQVEKIFHIKWTQRTSEIFFPKEDKLRFTCSSQCVIFFLLQRCECFENYPHFTVSQAKEWCLQWYNVSSLVRIWKILYVTCILNVASCEIYKWHMLQ